MAIDIKRKFRIVEWVANIVLFILISFSFYLTIPIKTTTTIFVPQGSVSNIITQLTKRGYSLSAIDKYILVAMGKPQSGWITIGKTDLNRIDFLHKLVTAKAQMVKITLIPGETTTIFLQEVAKELNLDSDKLHKYMDRYAAYKEAGVYANTYYVPYGIQEKQLILFLVSQTNREYREFSNKIYGTYSIKDWNRILTIASIIQKEAANKEEMPLISSVIYNRLRKKMPLQMDGSLNYGKYSHIKVTPERIKNDKSKFNTYRYKGVPPYPVCAVSLDAIKSAIKPARTNYLYFMRNSKGKHDFSSSFREHRQNIQRVKN
ncbi:FIG004453: protein YceG like [hydrothermal vent metagenome]|uniref:FIG004453: protein YceG like n=1 Tax=hydrothermal vent metagenome TaxID=652676 RepID=A0A1W1B8P6_9ZZZZ